MGRVTDDERREIAENLRYDADYPGCAIQYMEQFISVLRETVFNDAICDADYSEIFQRLADLIEPSEPKVKCVAEVKVDGGQLEKLVHDAAVEMTGVDRDALLALADDVDGAADDSGGFEPLAGMLRDIARRIREALGVSE